MITKQQITEVLRNIEYPEFNRSIVELELVKDIVINDGKINIDILAIKNTLTEQKMILDIKDAINSIEELDIDVNLCQMTIDDIKNLKGKLLVKGSPLFGSNPDVKFISVASGKGGVGKSTVSVNLAISLARQGKKVGLVDADIYGFSVPEMMGIKEKPTALDQNFILPIEKHGVKVISMGFFVSDNNPIIWRGPMLGKMIQTFFEDIYWGDIEYLILDLPPGTGDVALDAHRLLPKSKEIIITTPQSTAALVAERAGTMAVKTEHEIIGVIENMSYYECKCGERAYIFGQEGGKKLATELKTELLGQLPIKVHSNNINEANPSIYCEDSDIGKIFSDIAVKLVEKSL